MTGLRFFDEFLQSDKPSSAVLGMEPIKVIYGEGWESSLLPVNQNTVILGTQENWLISTFLPSLAGGSNSVVCLDVENYAWGNRNNQDAATVNDSRTKMSQLIDIYRENRPDLHLGYYATGPVRDYWRATGSAGDKVEWQEDNRQFQAVFNAQDFLMPSVYTFYEDQAGNSNYIAANIAEAKINAKGKPVYPFVWPWYHDSNPTVGGTLIPHEYFRRIIDDVKKAGADGIVFWGGFGDAWANMSETYNVIRRFVADWRK